MKKCWEIKNNMLSGQAEILLYGTISDESWLGDEATPKQFADDLASLGGRDILVRVNSPGGDVFAGQAIYSQLITYPGNVDARIDGLAASAAVLVVCACRTVTMPSNALLMIHNPAIGLCGYYGADEFANMQNYLSTVKQTIINAYQKKCKNKISNDELSGMMDQETWMQSTEAQQYGFIDIVDEDEAVENILNDGCLVVNKIKHDIKKFQNVIQLERIINKKEENNVPKDDNSGLINAIRKLISGAEPQNISTTQPEKSVETANEVDNAVIAERQRLLDLDALNLENNAVIAVIVNDAKKTGKKVDDIKNIVENLKESLPESTESNETEANKALNFLKQAFADNGSSNVNNITANGQGKPLTKNEEQAQAADFMATYINKKNGKDVKK